MGILVILGVILGLFVLLIAFGFIKEKRSFYTPTNCNICGKRTGYKGNERYELTDGYICRACAIKASSRTSDTDDPSVLCGPKLYKNIGVSTAEIISKIKRREEIGEERWQEEQAQAAAESLRQRSAATDNQVRCPKCGSTSISADKKGFGVGKAVIGAAVAGPLGLAAGNVGAKKVRVTCLKCGHQWTAGKG